MSPRAAPTDRMSVSERQVAGFRLERHHLLRRAARGSLVRVAGAMGGAQAQLVPAAQLSLAARTDDLRPEDVSRALVPRRTLVKAGCMRRTLHLVPARELAMFARGTRGRADREITWMRNAGFSASTIDGLVGATLAALEQPLTREELGKRIAARLGLKLRIRWGGMGWGNRSRNSGLAVGRWTIPIGYLIHVVAARGVVCYGAAREGEPTFVRGDAWVPGWKDLSEPAAEEGLLRRYLAAFGPATLTDFVRWTGVRHRHARQIWERIRSEIVPVAVDGRPASILRSDRTALERADSRGAPARLLPYFDGFVLGHEERTHLVAADRHAAVYRPQGWVAPVVLEEGRVIATWAHSAEGGRLRVGVTPFRRLSPETVREIRREADHLSEFLGLPSASVQVVARPAGSGESGAR